MKKLNVHSIRFCFLALLTIQVLACSSKKEIVTDTGTIQGNTLIKLKYNRSSVLRNPMNGWVMYGGRTSDESYWDTEYYVSDLGKKAKVSDYASACYIRTSWSSLNPSDGVYSWNDTTSQIGKLIAGADKRGLPIAFRIVVDGRDQGPNTPQFVFEKGAKFYLENSKFPDRKTPYPQDPIFRQYYTKFIQALAEKFNDPTRTAFIDGYGLGKWGEGHAVIYEDPNNSDGSNTEALKEEVMHWITDLYAKAFTKIPLLMNYHRLIGDPLSWGAVNPNSDKLLNIAINNGYSLRQDAFGMTDYYTSWEKQYAKTWNFKRPIVMEGGWITTGTHRYWTDPSGKYREDHPEDVRQGEFDASKEACVNMMDFRVGGETASWFEKAFPLVQRFVSEGGYRIYPDQISIPEVINSGDEIAIMHRWRNMGWGYFPNNIPQWNYKYKVGFAVLDENNKVKKIIVDTNSEPSNWLKEKPTEYILKTNLDLPKGQYQWAVALVDTSNENKPGVKLAVNEAQIEDGWIILGNLKIQ